MTTKDETVEEELRELPLYARKIVSKMTQMRLSAFFYRRKLVAWRSAINEILKQDADGYKIVDQIVKKANANEAILQKFDSPKEKEFYKSLVHEIAVAEKELAAANDK